MEAGIERESLIEEYRALLQAEPSRRALQRSLILLQRVASIKIEPWEGMQKALRSLQDEEESLTAAQQQFREDVIEFMQRELADRAARRNLAREQLRLSQLAYEVAVAVDVALDFVEGMEPSLPRWREAFLVDIALVVFHQAYFGLLEDDLDPKMRNLLLASFMRFSNRLTPADQSRVRALTCDALEQHELAEGYFLEALARSSSDAHEFMTLLQTAWSHMIQHGRFWGAMRVLVRYAKKIPDRHLAEYRELAVTTLDLLRASGRAA